MHWLIKLLILWLCADIVFMATVWFVWGEIQPRYPHWWRQHIVDVDPWQYNNTRETL